MTTKDLTLRWIVTIAVPIAVATSLSTRGHVLTTTATKLAIDKAQNENIELLVAYTDETRRLGTERDERIVNLYRNLVEAVRYSLETEREEKR